MASITDSLTYTGSYTPFERPPESFTLSSLIPRGVRRFFLQEATTLKGTTDELRIHMDAVLPDSFAYAIRRFDAQIRATNIEEGELSAQLSLFNHIPGVPLGSEQYISIPMVGSQRAFGANEEQLTSAPADLSDFVSPCWSTQVGSITFRFDWMNKSAFIQGAGFCNSYVEFLEYDLVQAQRYWVNTPVPVMRT